MEQRNKLVFCSIVPLILKLKQFSLYGLAQIRQARDKYAIRKKDIFLSNISSNTMSKNVQFPTH